MMDTSFRWTSGRIRTPHLIGQQWILGVTFIWILVVGSVSGICVWQGGGGFRLACGFKQSGLFRLRSLGGLKGWAGAGFTVGDEEGFKDSLTNTEPKQRLINQPGNQYQLSQRIAPQQPLQQYGQYSQVMVQQPQVHAQVSGNHESEHVQKRASLWNSWKWPSIIQKKKQNPNQIGSMMPQRIGPMQGIQQYPLPYQQQMSSYNSPTYHVPSPYYPNPYVNVNQQYPMQVHHPVRIPHYFQHPGLHNFQKPSNMGTMPEFSPMPELDPLYNGSEEMESQIEPVLKVGNSEEKRKRNRSRKPYGLQLLENSENYGKKFKISENSVPLEDPSLAVTGYDTNLFPDIYFTSTTPRNRNRLKKILEAEIENELPNDQESTTEAILRKLRLKKIKLLKKGHNFKLSKQQSKEVKELKMTTEELKPTTEKLTSTTEKLTSTTQKSTTTTSKVPTTTTKLTTTSKPTTTTTQKVHTSTTTERPKPPMIMRTRPTERPDFADSFYRGRERDRDIGQGQSIKQEDWRYMTSPRSSGSSLRSSTSSPHSYTSIAQNPLIQSGKWKEIYDPRYPPDHEVNRGKLELLAAALTTTSQRPRYLKYHRDGYPQSDEYIKKIPEEYIPKLHDEYNRKIPDEYIRKIPDEYIRKIPDEYIRKIPDEYVRKIPGEYISPKLHDEYISKIHDYPRQEEYIPRREIEYPPKRDDGIGPLNQIKMNGREGEFVKFDSHESLDLVNRTKSYNDAFYSHFNKSAIEMSDQPSPTPFHYFSAFSNQKVSSTVRPPPSPAPYGDWIWDKAPSGAHFSRNDYSPSTTEGPPLTSRPVDRWSGLSGIPDSSSIENTRPRLDHSTETGDFLRKKAMNILSANWEHGNRFWDNSKSDQIRHPNFVTDDNFKVPKYPSYIPDVTTKTTVPPTTPATYYFSSTPSYNDWKSYVGAVSGLSSTTEITTTTTTTSSPIVVQEIASSREGSVNDEIGTIVDEISASGSEIEHPDHISSTKFIESEVNNVKEKENSKQVTEKVKVIKVKEVTTPPSKPQKKNIELTTPVSKVLIKNSSSDQKISDEVSEGNLVNAKAN